MKANKETVRSNLEELLTCNPGSFVTVSHPETDKFVQVLGSRGEDLQLYFGIEYVTDPEADRAKLFFTERGVELEQLPYYSEPNPEALMGYSPTFIMNCGSDVEKAAVTMLEVFSHIYNLPDLSSLIVEISREAWQDWMADL